MNAPAILTTPTLTVTSDGAVAEVTLSRPELLNRFDADLHVDVVAALEAIRHTDGIRAAVLASTGKVFSAGGDFELMLALRADVRFRNAQLDEGRRLFRTLLDTPVPIVVALHGDAIGLAATVVLATDAVVAARTAGLCDPHVTLGLVAGDGGCVVWPAAAGMLRAKRHLLTGDRIDAETAFTLGLVTDLVDTAADTLPAARALAARLAALPPLAVQGTKRALNRALDQRAGEVLDLSLALEAQTMASDDLAEAIAAFRAKYRPTYHGR